MSHMYGVPSPTPRRALALTFALCAAPLACAASEDDEGGANSGGKADDLDDTGLCAGRVFDKRGGDDGTDVIDLSERGDVFARLVLQAAGDPESCPTSFAEIMAKLRETDKENCEGARDGLSTAVVSETSQVMGKADSFRSVTMRQCGSRDSHELLFSLFGLTGKTTKLPESVEIISFDSANEVFAYYAVENGEMNFFGTSNEFMVGQGGRCQNCHPAGGLNMKELAAPWVHWEGDTTTPGAQQLVDEFDDLGSQSNGIALEGVVDSGNQAIVDVRARTLLATNDLKQVLRPLFCTVQINIAEASSGSNGAPPSSIPASPFVGSLAFDSVPVTADEYKAAIKASGQKIVGPNGTTQLKNKSGKLVVDNFFAFAFVETSREDSFYFDELERLKVIDRDFRNDVLAVDITRPVFSEARCALLESAPDLGKLTTSSGKPISGLTKKIRDGFVENLASAEEGSPGAQLRTNLGNTSDSAMHEASAAAFMTACKARPAKDFLTDALKIISLQRNLVREMAVMEFPSSLPFDKLSVDPGTFFDPATCTLVVP